MPKDDTGRLVLRPRTFDDGSSTAPVDNPDQTAGATDELQKQQPPTPALDPYAAAAIAALQKRNATKAAQSKKKTAAKAADAEEADTAGPKGPERPKRATPNSRKRPAAAVEDVPKSKILKQMPKVPSDGSNPPPVFYHGGVIYTSLKTKRFRALPRRGDMNHEKQTKWTTKKPSSADWKRCVQSMDAMFDKKGLFKR